MSIIATMDHNEVKCKSALDYDTENHVHSDIVKSPDSYVEGRAGTVCLPTHSSRRQETTTTMQEAVVHLERLNSSHDSCLRLFTVETSI